MKFTPLKRMSPFAIGTRIMHNGDRGYVRYYGEVKGYEGVLWYGIEWESPQKRGKHNGAVKDVKYFETKHPKGGSFVRSSEDIFDGAEMVSLIAQRYSESSVNYMALVNKMDITIEDEHIQDTDEKESEAASGINVSRLFAITLDHYPLTYCKPSNISFYACKDLVLSHTLLSKWSNLFDMLKLFPNISLLDISDNAMENLSNIENLETKRHINTLKVNQCNMDDESAHRLLMIFPSLAELHLTGNRLKTLKISSDYESLETLYIQENNIENMNNLSEVAKLPRLKYLNISSCNISKISVAGNFSKLEKLVAAENNIRRWEDIGDLSTFPALKQLVLNVRLPVPQGLDPREVMVVKFPNLIELDRLDISPLFRRNCEYDFLRKIASVRPIPSYFKADIQRLISLYPDFAMPDLDDDISPNESTKKESIHLRFACGNSTFEKTFDSTQDFLPIIKTVCRKMKVPSRGVEIYIHRYNESADGQMEELVTHLDRNIKSYDLDENSTIVLKVAN